MAKNNLSTRVCTSCGLKKPLSAFLQISGREGTRYGSICSTCRGTGVKEKTTTDARDDSQGSSTQLKNRIGAKEKIYAEMEQKRQLDTLKELYREDTKKRDTLLIQKTQSFEIRERSDKDRRNSYLDAKKTPGFLDKTSSSEQKKSAEKRVDATGLSEQEQAVESKKQVDYREQEQKKTTADLTVPFLDALGEEKYRSVTFRQFKEWLGFSAPIRAQEQQKKFAQEKPDAAKKEQDPVDYINKTWKPTSRRR